VAFLLSDACTTSGETFAVGGSRVARVALAENAGATGADAGIEAAGQCLAQALQDGEYCFPRDLSERSVWVNRRLGFDGGLDASGRHAVGPGAPGPL